MGQVYTLCPRPQGPFAGLSPAARIAFGLIWDRWQMTGINTHCNGVRGFVLKLPPEAQPRYGRPTALYCVYKHAELASDAGVSERTIRRAVDELTAARLLDAWRRGALGPSCYTIPPDVVAYMGGPAWVKEMAKRKEPDGE